MRGSGFRVVRPSRGVRFSPTEVRHILLALGVLILAFALVLARGRGPFLEAFLRGLLLAAIAVPAAFLLHELGHKVVAQGHGHWAEFRAWNTGLLLAVVTAFLGFLFAAPGAVRIAGPVTPRENGRISAAGPLVNLVIGAGFLGLWFVLRLSGLVISLGGLMSLSGLAAGVAYISLILGVFNMIPVAVLDGRKILQWDVRFYLLLLAPLGALLALFFLFPGVLLAGAF